MFVFSNLATSLDGKIATRVRGHHPLGTAEDRRQMLVLRRQCDVVLMGAGTLRAYRRYCGAGQESPRQPANAVVSTALEGISPAWPFFKFRGGRRLLFVSDRLTAARVRRFERVAELVPLRRETARRPAAAQILQALGERGCERVLIEGGGGLMWDFVRFNLIDEYHVTLTPKVVGGRDAPSLVEGEGFAPSGILSLRLAQSRVVGNELYLTYRKR